MNALTAILALAGTAGIGYLVYKKMNEKKENTSAYTEYREETANSSKGGKIHRASMYAVGTIKTTADKISEGIKQVKSEDMVKKGEETIEQMKESGESFKEQVKETTSNLKEQVKEATGNVRDQVKETTGTVKEQVKEATGNIKEEIKETGVNIKDELSEIKNLVTSINSSPSDAEEIALPDDGIPEAEVEDIDENSLFEEIEIVDQL